VRVGDDEQETRESEGGEEGEEAGVPELVRDKTDGGGGAKTESESSHESHGGEDAEGGKEEMAGVEEIGMHGAVRRRSEFGTRNKMQVLRLRSG
jgi:hypothetical protein